MNTTPAPKPHKPSPLVMLVAVPLATALVLALFAWPSANLEPRDLPVGVAGAPAAAEQLEQGLAKREGAFEVHRYATEAAARDAIDDREVYGAFVATPAGPKVLTASAASPAVAQLLTHAASESGAGANGKAVPVEDVASASPAAAGLASSVLPLMIAGLLTGALSALLASRTRSRVGLVVAGSVLAGLAATAIVQSWLGVVEGDWAANAAGLTLTVLAIAASTAGLYLWLGQKGLILGLLTMVLIGNPFSGVGSAPEMLPEPVGGIGQLMPPGAGANLLRSTGFFDGAGGGGHAAVLAIWALAGLALMIAASGFRPSAKRQRVGPVVQDAAV